jgi:MYXO-CTERM domain-containing protein
VKLHARLLALSVIAVHAACSSPGSTTQDAAPGADLGAQDSGRHPDAAPSDRGFIDAVDPFPDATEMDAGEMDAGEMDAGITQDATDSDAGLAPDATDSDAGFDAGGDQKIHQGGAADGCNCRAGGGGANGPAPALLFGLAGLCGLRRRRR